VPGVALLHLMMVLRVGVADAAVADGGIVRLRRVLLCVVLLMLFPSLSLLFPSLSLL
jgi:hypothetical protein